MANERHSADSQAELYRPGLEGVVAGETAISTISGGLEYRGYAVEELADRVSFEEVAWLLLAGELPAPHELASFKAELTGAVLPAAIVEALRAIPPAAPLMDVMRSGASLLAHWDPDATDDSPAANRRKAGRLLGQLPQVMAARFRLLRGEQPLAPRPGAGLAENILWLLFGRPPTTAHVRALDVSLTMYAEHEFNASTFTARVVVSTLSDLHSALVAAIGALKGPLHGGANERVLDVLEAVGSPENTERWLRAALAAKQRVMGFGHRVYRTGDPRAVYLKRQCQELAARLGDDSLERTADAIERILWQEKSLPPNLDWPSARLYKYLGLPVELYTPLFVCSRTAGWCAHAAEQLANNRLIRPRSRYVGPAARPVRPAAER